MFAAIATVALAMGLAASCGFRIFVPMLVISIASRTELLTLSDGFAWVGSTTAITVFAVATVIEIAAYYIPWLDNFLDSISTPSAVIAGVVVSAACVHDLHPVMKWSLAIIAGGGTAGIVKAGLVSLRLGSTSLTGGVANPIVSTVEWLSSIALSLLALFLPILAGFVAIGLLIALVRFAWKLAGYLRNRSEPQAKDGTKKAE
jgi:hypothetical protein